MLDQKSSSVDPAKFCVSGLDNKQNSKVSSSYQGSGRACELVASADKARGNSIALFRGKNKGGGMVRVCAKVSMAAGRLAAAGDCGDSGDSGRLAAGD